MMIDWISGFIEAPPEAGPLYDTGRFLRISPGGEVEQVSSASVFVEGSHDSRLMVRSPRGSDLYLSGNIVKHLQGHNLFGSADPDALFFAGGLSVRQAVGLFPGPATWQSNGFTGPRYTRLDLTRSYRFPTADDARAWLRDVASTARSRHGGAISTGTTVYLGKGSERWTFKVYHKGDEVRAKGKFHRIAALIDPRRVLDEWAQGVVRFELTLRSKELVKLDLSSITIAEVWRTYFDRVTLNQNWRSTTMNDLLEQQLTPTLKGALAQWRLGVDLRTVYPRNTFYRHRRAILQATGIDVGAPPPRGPLPVAPPDSRTVLDPAGWDPEPLEAHLYRPDPTLPLRYRSKSA